MSADYAVDITLVFYATVYIVLQLLSIFLIRYFQKNHNSSKINLFNKGLVVFQFLLLLAMIGTLLNAPLTYTYSLMWHGNSEQGPVYFNVFYIGLALLHLLTFSITYFYGKYDLIIRKYSKISVGISILILISIYAYYKYYKAFIYVDMSGG